MNQTNAQIDYTDGEILVQFMPEVSQQEMDAVMAARDCAITGQSGMTGYYHVAIPEGSSPIDMAVTFGGDPGCEWASPNFIAHNYAHTAFPIPPNDPFYGFQTHLFMTNVEGAWAKGIGDQSVVVAVIDSGVAYENRPIPASELGFVVPGAVNYLVSPDLAQTHFTAGFDFINGDPNANDDRFHGTAVTGTITQDTNNGLRLAGVAPGITIMPIKAIGFNGSGTLAALIDAIAFATANNADVINMSLGFAAFASDPAFDSFFVGLDAAIEAAYDAGVVLVAATGNEGVGLVSRPAIHPDIIAVGASNFDGATRSGYSQFSSLEAGFGIPPTPGLPGSTEIVAPVGDFSDFDGNGIPDAVLQETMFGNDPENFGVFLLTGTSFASPQVAGAAALMISAGQRKGKDGFSVAIIRQLLRETAVDLGPLGADLEFGAGQLDIAAACSAKKIDICHTPPGNPGNAHTIRVSIDAARAHLAHGDTLGSCQ